MFRRLIVWTAALAAPLLTGCSPQFEHIESAVDRNHVEIQRLRDEQTVLAREVGGIADLLRNDQGGGLENEARLQAQLSQVLRRLDQITQKQDDNQEYMRNLSARVDLLATRLGLPTLGEFKEAAPGGADLQALPEEGRAIFNAALLDRDRGNDDLARQGFTEFLDRYPSSEMADDARYWLGELAYGRGDYEAALADFLTLATEFPQAERRPDALQKAVLSAQALGDAVQARSLLERLQNDYPGSEQAALAAAALQAD